MGYVYGEQQQKEIATIRERTFTLKLSDADVDRLALKATEAGMEMGELLANFVGDLVGGTYSNGSDERMYAQNWYERCGFSFYPTTDLARLAKFSDLKSMVDYCKYYQSAVEDLESIKQDFKDPDCDDVFEEDVKDAEKYLAECKSDVEYEMKCANCEGTLEKVVAEVLKWDEELRRFKAQTGNDKKY